MSKDLLLQHMDSQDKVDIQPLVVAERAGDVLE